MWNFCGLESLEDLNNSIIIAKTTGNLGHTDQERLSPPLHQLVPPETRLVSVCEDLTVGFQLYVTLWWLLLGNLRERGGGYMMLT